MPTIDELKSESVKLRKLIESCDPSNMQLLFDGFPVMSCKVSSLLLAHHLLIIWPELKFKGVGGVAGKFQEITQYWLEVNNVIIDITSDQYNMLEDRELNDAIIQHRPFNKFNVESKDDSHLYQLFDLSYKNLFQKGFPTFAEDLIENIETDYASLVSHVKW